MNLVNIKSKKIAVLGFGLEGQAVMKYFLRHGIKPVLFDERPILNKQLLKKGIKIVTGPGCFKKLSGFDLVFRSPGIQLSKLQYLNKTKTVITSQTKFFFQNCPAKIIGVTGTKGKGTTVSLIFEMLKLHSKISNLKSQIYLTGNIGKVQPLEILEKLTSRDWVVFELSSFQLQDLDLSPHIAVVLMVTSEHLDYHKNIAEYIKAKSSIVKYQNKHDFAAVNADFSASKKIGKLGAGQKYFFSRTKSVYPGSFVRKETVVISNKNKQLFSIIDSSRLQLKGRHNLENICAASVAAMCAGCGLGTISKVAQSFKGLEHRLEFVGQKSGVKYYNDSFSTTPETAIAAIQAFSEPEIVILGGSSKKSNFSGLGKIISKTKNIKALVLIGEESSKIQKTISTNWLKNHQVYSGAKNMTEIFKQVLRVASSGDVVLLSPACASFDMFENYQDRGLKFKNAVSKLK